MHLFKNTIFGTSTFQNVCHARMLPTCAPAPPSSPWAQSPQELLGPQQLPSCRRSTGPCGCQIQPGQNRGPTLTRESKVPLFETVIVVIDGHNGSIFLPITALDHWCPFSVHLCDHIPNQPHDHIPATPSLTPSWPPGRPCPSAAPAPHNCPAAPPPPPARCPRHRSLHTSKLKQAACQTNFTFTELRSLILKSQLAPQTLLMFSVTWSAREAPRPLGSCRSTGSLRPRHAPSEAVQLDRLGGRWTPPPASP